MKNPNVPESLEGWHILHRMFRLDRHRWENVPGMQRDELARQAMMTLGRMHSAYDGDLSLSQLLGHKADLMVTHYARSFEKLAIAQVQFDRMGICHFLRPVSSFVSILELGLYSATAKIHTALAERELEPQSDEWIDAFDEMLVEEARDPRNGVRLWAKIPERRYVTFYPMNKKRGEINNWYALPFEDRAALMHDHGKIGRTYHGQVSQVISGAVGLDDWEWGVDLYADDPTIFKSLVYEMRFDAASSLYGEFGPFYTGMQFSISELGTYLRGDAVPQLLAEDNSSTQSGLPPRPMPMRTPRNNTN